MYKFRLDWLKFVRLYLKYNNLLSHVNYADGDDGFGPSVKRSELPLWSYLGQLFYVYFTLKLCMCEVFQHNYNSLTNELKNSMDTLMTPDSANSSNNYNRTGRWSEAKQLELNVTIERLNLIGNGAYESGYVVEPMFVFVLLMSYVSYAQMHAYNFVRAPVRLDPLMVLLNPERQRKQMQERRLEPLVATFIASSYNFLQARQNGHFAGACSAASRLARRQDDAVKVADASTINCYQRYKRARRDIELEHELAVVAVRSMARRGELLPLNRRQPECLEKLAKFYGVFIVLFEIFAVTLAFAVVAVMPLLGIVHLKEDYAPQDLLFYFEFVSYCIVGGQVISYPILLMIVTAYDHLQYVQELRRMVANILQDMSSESLAHLVIRCRDERQSGQLVPEPQSIRIHQVALPEVREETIEEPSSSCHDATQTNTTQLNVRLMRVLLLYKLFNQQLASTQAVIGWIGANAAAVILLVPFLARVYAAFFSLETRLAILATTLAIISICEIMILPHCWLYARCIDLFKALSRVLAHLDALPARAPSADESRTKTSSNYDAHTVWLLRRELDLPERAVRRFATDAFFLDLTFASFIGVHFWCGLLLAPLLVGDSMRPGVEGGGNDNLLTSTLRLF